MGESGGGVFGGRGGEGGGQAEGFGEGGGGGVKVRMCVYRELRYAPFRLVHPFRPPFWNLVPHHPYMTMDEFGRALKLQEPLLGPQDPRMGRTLAVRNIYVCVCHGALYHLSVTM